MIFFSNQTILSEKEINLLSLLQQLFLSQLEINHEIHEPTAKN
jgi:hypothetical protein